MCSTAPVAFPSLTIHDIAAVDHSGDIDVHEFTAWMGRWRPLIGVTRLTSETVVAVDHKVSRTKTAMIVVKIVMGLGQVVSKQPEVVKQDFPGPQW